MNAHFPRIPESDPIEIWTIYDHPKDAPEFFVARKWLIGRDAVIPTSEILSGDDLDTLRNYFSIGGLHCLPRQPGDDPVIVESWL